MTSTYAKARRFNRHADRAIALRDELAAMARFRKERNAASFRYRYGTFDWRTRLRAEARSAARMARCHWVALQWAMRRGFKPERMT